MAKQTRVRAVVHINFDNPQRQDHGLQNVEKILNECDEAAEIEVIAHGPGVSLLVRQQNGHSEKIRKLADRGVRFTACENTLKERDIEEDTLLPGVTMPPSGAVELLRRQQEGFAYDRP